jgi:site-specific DNA-cytosine methylase
MPRISWLNWVRLALIPAGGDWRDLAGVLDGQPRRTVFRRHHVSRWDAPSATVAGSGSNGPSAVADPRPWFRGTMGVKGWDEASGTITGNARPCTGAFSVADPRPRDWFRHVLRVTPWDEPAGTVTGSGTPTSGGTVVADPRLAADNPNRHWSKYRIVPWERPAGAVCGATRPGSGSPNVADPRIKRAYDHAYAVIRWHDEPSPTVAAGSHPGQGAYAVGDPRLGCAPRAGAYGVIPWREAAKTVTGSACIDNGSWAVQDPRLPGEPVMLVGDVRKAPAAVPLIVSDDDTWHRPLTTLELGVLQGLPHMLDGKPLVLAGSRVSAWRERIGNAVPTPAARAIAEQMLVTLTHGALSGFALSGSNEVWVRHEDGELPAWYAPVSH